MSRVWHQSNQPSNTEELDEFYVRAVNDGNYEGVDHWLSMGANVDARSVMSDYDLNSEILEPNVSYTALTVAVIAGDIAMTQRLLCHGADVHAVDEVLTPGQDSLGQTALHLAFLVSDKDDHNEFELPEILCAAGAQVDRPYNTGGGNRTIMQDACRDLDFATIHWLLCHGSDPEPALIELVEMERNIEPHFELLRFACYEMATIRVNLIRCKTRERVRKRTRIFEEELMIVCWKPEGALFKYYVEHDDDI